MSIMKWNRNSDFFPSILGEIFNEEVFDKISNRVSVPAVNLVESDNSYEIHMAAPGLKKEDFKISLENKVLTISSEKSTESEEVEDKFTRKEYSYSSFSRSFTLPENTDIEGIEAKYENGELRLNLPKKEKTTDRLIEVSVS
ncbi:MAG: Hsp20/alpha crystallin family protein [Xanthomarina sp.]